MLKDIDWIKASLLAGMGICVLLLLREWDNFSPPNSIDYPAAEGQQGIEPTVISLDDETPFSSPAQPLQDVETAPLQTPQNVAAAISSNTIKIKTDVLELVVDLNGGNFIQADLIEFHQALNNDTPFRMLSHSTSHTYVAKSGLLLNQGQAFSPLSPNYQASAESFELAPGQDKLIVELVSQTADFQLVKRLTLKRGDYLIDVEHQLQNKTNQSWQGALFAQIDRDDLRPPSNTGFGMKPYVGAAVTQPDDRYNKIDFDDMDEPLNPSSVDTGWVALLQHYFVSAWIPSKDQSLKYELGQYAGKNLYYLGFTQPAFEIPAGGQTNFDASFYVGPKDQYRLQEISNNLDLTVDYGWLWWAAQPLYWVLQKVHSFTGNWGVAIILLTCLIKLLFFPLSAASYKSMARMRKLTPKMQALKERYGDDRQTLSQETMKLYQKEKVNPLGGCLPILIQMPIFLALYWVLIEAVELRHAPFIGWIQDLSAKDPWYLLPILMGLSMMVQMRLNPAPPDPMQAKVMQFMPIMFAVMMAFFPAGLVLYWTVNNLLSITQQWVITRRIEAGG